MKLNNLIITALAGFSVFLGSCQNNDENEQHYDNKLFISASNFTLFVSKPNQNQLNN